MDWVPMLFEAKKLDLSFNVTCQGKKEVSSLCDEVGEVIADQGLLIIQAGHRFLGTRAARQTCALVRDSSFAFKCSTVL